MDKRTSNLLDEALGSDGRIILIEDSVETSGAFLLHHLIKRSLRTPNTGVIVFVALAHPDSHYDRILRKLGYNMSQQMENNKFILIDEFNREWESDDCNRKNDGEKSLVKLYLNIRSAVEVNELTDGQKNHVTVMIDDASLLDVAADGASNHVTDFIHYCHTLTSDYDCSMVILSHGDIYSCVEGPTPLLQLEYLADLIVRVEPLATGLAADVHGQLTILNKCPSDERRSSRPYNFHFKVKENSVDYFYPGSQV